MVFRDRGASEGRGKGGGAEDDDPRAGSNGVFFSFFGPSDAFCARPLQSSSSIFSLSHRVSQQHELDAGHRWRPGLCSDAADGVGPRGRRRGGWEESFFFFDRGIEVSSREFSFRLCFFLASSSPGEEIVETIVNYLCSSSLPCLSFSLSRTPARRGKGEKRRREREAKREKTRK